MNPVCSCEGTCVLYRAMTTTMVADAVQAVVRFDEPHLGRLVAEYVGGVCATYAPVHGVVELLTQHPVFKMTLAEPHTVTRAEVARTTRPCYGCQRPLCEACVFTNHATLCSGCGALLCPDCRDTTLQPCGDCGTVRRFCVFCVTTRLLRCCAQGRTQVRCMPCRMTGASVACAGCRDSLCSACVQRRCRCGWAWCQACFSYRTNAVCPSPRGQYCLGCPHCTDGHQCLPRKAKARQYYTAAALRTQKRLRLLK